MKEIVLASSSPRRQELLKKIGLKFRVEASDLPEPNAEGLEPREFVRRLSLGKAEVVAGRNRDAIVIAADTVGILEGRIIGKPRTQQEAFEMLQALSGTCHTVVTGFTVVDTGTKRTITRTVETEVCFRNLSEAEIRAYVSTGEPMDKAGAYAIQGIGSLLVDRIQGDFYNVIGLPLSALAETLKEFGIDLLPAPGVKD